MARLFTDEQDAFVRKNAEGLFNQELANLVNRTFELSVTAAQMSNYKRNHGIKSGVTGHFPKGHVPFNKGKKGLTTGGVETQFKKGHKPANYKPVGYERIDRDGYTLIKVQDDGPWHKRWRFKHVVVWEEANGPIPKGHCLLFADQDKTNISLENLILISRKQLATLNKKALLTNNADLNRTGIIVADLFQKISERKNS